MTDPARLDAAPLSPDEGHRQHSGRDGASASDGLASAIAEVLARNPRQDAAPAAPAQETVAAARAPHDPLAARLYAMQTERLRRAPGHDDMVEEPAVYTSAGDVDDAFADDAEWRPYAPVLGDLGERRASRFRRAAVAAVGAVALVGVSAAAAFVFVTSGDPAGSPSGEAVDAVETAEAPPETETVAAATATPAAAEEEEAGIAAADVPEAPETTPVVTGANEADAADESFPTASVRTIGEEPSSAPDDEAEPAEAEADGDTIANAYAPREAGQPADFAAIEPGSDIGVAAASPAEEGSATRAAPTGTGAVTSDVNLRAEPTNDGEVLRVVPNGASVDVVSCDMWCEVDYSGERGFIYSSFVDTGATETGAAETGAADVGAAETGAADTGAAEAADTVAPTSGGLL